MSSKKIVVKFKYENESDVLKMPLNDNHSTGHFQTQQTDYFNKQKNKSIEILSLHHLYNPVTRMYIQEIKEIYDNSIIFQMKNCKNHAIEISQKLLQGIQSSQSLNMSISSLMPQAIDFKKILFELSNCLKIARFADEFIQEDGINLLLKILEITSGNTQTAALKAFSALMEYQNAIQNLEDNNELFEQFFKILMMSSQTKGNVSMASTSLMLFASIIGIMEEKGCEKFICLVTAFANENSSKPYKEIISFVNDESIDIRVNAILLICILVKFSNSKSSKMKMISDLLEAGLVNSLVGYLECKSPKFRDYVQMFFLLARQCGMPIDLEIEKYKQTIEKLEENCASLEKKISELTKNQTFYDEIVNEFIDRKSVV